MPMIEVKNLTKRFESREGSVDAVQGVNLVVKSGSIFGFLGPNGAGKTTTLRMLTTLLAPTEGSAVIAGYDLKSNPEKIREHIGYVSQVGGSMASATGLENLVLQGRLYGMSKADAQHRAQELIKMFQLENFAHRQARTYSGGQRRRLDIALGIMHSPKLLFLDEPTTGLDPQSRSYFWGEVRRLRDSGMTIFLTTHYLEEADALCDRLAIIDHGRIVSEGTPDELKRQTGGDTVLLGFESPADRERATELLTGMSLITRIVSAEGTQLKVAVASADEASPSILQALLNASIVLRTLESSKPSLDDVFLLKTGHALRDSSN